MFRLRLLPAFLLSVFLAGCSAPLVSPRAASTALLEGSVHGGQQPVTGAQIQLYAVGTTADGSASTPLLAAPVLTDARGAFSFTLPAPCPSSTTLVYLAATGGNPGLAAGTSNPAFDAIAAIGTCTDLAQSTYLSLNEVTTVAAVNALAPYLASTSAIGSTSAHAQALAGAFTLATQYASTATGRSPGVNLPSGYTAPQSLLYTLADAIAPCVNSTGADGNCATLFSYLTPPNAAQAPTELVGALLNLANNPNLNTAQLYSLATPSAPFQPILTASPQNFALALVPYTAPSTVVLSPAALTFPAGAVNFNQNPMTLTLTNNTANAIPAPTFAIAGANAADFTASNASSSCLYPVLPAASCSFSVRFSPSAAGTRTATFTVTSGSNVLSSTLSGTGSGTGPAGPLLLSGAPTWYAAGTTYDLKLTNYGTSAVNFSSITVGYSRQNYQTFTQTNDCAPQLYAQSVCTIHLAASGVRQIGGYSSAYLNISDDFNTGYQGYPINQYPDQGTFPNYGGYVLGTTSPTSAGSSVNYGTSQPSISDSADFPFSVTSCLFAHGSDYCQYTVAFKPATIGPLTASISGASSNANLTGYGLPAAAYLKGSFTTGANVTYGTTTMLSGSVVNTGVYSVSLLAPTFSGPDAAAFIPGTCSATTNGSCSFGYSFTPTHQGDSYATVTVNDSTGTFHFTQAIDLVASPTPGTLSPSTLAFGSVNDGATSATLSTTIATAYNEAITVSIPGAPFYLVGASSCASTPCTVSFNFAPAYAQGYSGQAVVKDSNGNTLATLALNGTGTTPPVQTAPAVTLSPTSFTFNSRPVGSTSIATSGTITNSGTAVLNLSSVALTGANTTDYLFSSACGATLAVNASCSYNLSFSPTASGTRTAAIAVVSNAASSTDSVPLTGTAQ